MTSSRETLGDRIRAKRAKTRAAGNDARYMAQGWAKGYADSVRESVKAELKAYIDKRIAKLAADNNLTND
jgi:hypothetical protein